MEKKRGKEIVYMSKFYYNGLHHNVTANNNGLLYS